VGEVRHQPGLMALQGACRVITGVRRECVAQKYQLLKCFSPQPRRL
jgi:hypothetical protein